jgi:UV DNA damage repair endonuclease
MEKIRVGYACISVTTDINTNRICIMKNATDEKLRSLIKSNINSLKDLILYNIEKIYMFLE